MSDLKNVGSYRDSTSVTGTTFTDLEGTTTVNSTTQTTVPDVKASVSTGVADEMPSLSAPTQSLSMSVIAGLSQDAIMQMLGMDERKTAVDSGIATLQAHSEQRQEVLQERIETLQEQADKMKHQSLLDKIKQAFSYIGMALGAIACVATLVAGCATGNPLMIAGGLMMTVALVDQITTTATGGEQGIAAWFGDLAEMTGGNEMAAQIAGQVVSSLFGIVGGVMSGVGAGKVIASVADTSKILSVTSKISTAADIANGLTQVGSGAVGIASSVNQYDIINLQADTKVLDGILARIQAAQDLDTENLKKIMEKSQSVVTSVKEMIDDCSASLTTVVTGAPSMA